MSATGFDVRDMLGPSDADDYGYKKNDDYHPMQQGARVVGTQGGDPGRRADRSWCFALIWLVLFALAVPITLSFFYPKTPVATPAPTAAPTVAALADCIVDPVDADTQVCATVNDTVTFQHAGTLYGVLFPNGASQRGQDVQATGPNSFAGGQEASATGDSSFAFGYSGGPPVITPVPTPAPVLPDCLGEYLNSSDIPAPGPYGLRATGQGSWVLAWADQAGVVEARGLGASAQGMVTGSGTPAILSLGGGSHAEGCADQGYLVAQGKGTHVEGYAVGNTTLMLALGLGAHAEGYAKNGECTLALGDGSHAEGVSTRAEGYAAHAQGYQTRATGNYSSAEGYGYGGGGGSDPACIFFYIPDTMTPTNNITGPSAPFRGIASGEASHSEGWTTRALAQAGHSEGFQTISQGQHAHSQGTCTWAFGDGSHAEGGIAQASFDALFCSSSDFIYGTMPHTGPYALGTASHAEGVCSESHGQASHVEGRQTFALGTAAHAEGSYSVAGGSSSHAEGQSTRAMENYAHAEGLRSVVDAQAGHAEGCRARVHEDANCAHSEGELTSFGAAAFQGAYGRASHVEGRDSVTLEDAFAGHAGGVGGISYLEGMWAHGFRMTDDREFSQRVIYAQSEYTRYANRSPTFLFLPNILVNLPVLSARSAVWTGTLTVMGYGGGPPGTQSSTPFLYHQVWDICTLKLGRTVETDPGVHTIIGASPRLPMPVIYGTWFIDPVVVVDPLATFVNITGVGVEDNDSMNPGVETRWSIGWDVWEGDILDGNDEPIGRRRHQTSDGVGARRVPLSFHTDHDSDDNGKDERPLKKKR